MKKIVSYLVLILGLLILAVGLPITIINYDVNVQLSTNSYSKFEETKIKRYVDIELKSKTNYEVLQIEVKLKDFLGVEGKTYYISDFETSKVGNRYVYKAKVDISDSVLNHNIESVKIVTVDGFNILGEEVTAAWIVIVSVVGGLFIVSGIVSVIVERFLKNVKSELKAHFSNINLKNLTKEEMAVLYNGIIKYDENVEGKDVDLENESVKEMVKDHALAEKLVEKYKLQYTNPKKKAGYCEFCGSYLTNDLICNNCGHDIKRS